MIHKQYQVKFTQCTDFGSWKLRLFSNKNPGLHKTMFNSRLQPCMLPESRHSKQHVVLGTYHRSQENEPNAPNWNYLWNSDPKCNNLWNKAQQYLVIVKIINKYESRLMLANYCINKRKRTTCLSCKGTLNTWCN